MPTYAFMCERCKKSFEVVLTVAERAAAKAACPTCGAAAKAACPTCGAEAHPPAAGATRGCSFGL